MVPLSVLDLCPIPTGATAADALRDSVDLARRAEAWGFRRYWVAEHHNMPGIASAATAVVIAHLAAHTTRIRFGAGGIMLPNHAPLAIAEQFGTLASLHPGRIDLGIGRASGADTLATLALRGEARMTGDDLPDLLAELRSYFAPPQPGQRLRAVPGAGLDVPIWLLGSSLFSARLAAQLGLPFAFAAHFAPADLREALAVYRAGFTPSPQLARPHAMVGVTVVAADTDAEARRLFTSQQQAFVNLVRGAPSQVPPPVDDIEAYWTPTERARAQAMLGMAVVGSPRTVARGLEDILALTAADELIVTGHLYRHEDRVRSHAIVAGLIGG